MNKKTKQICIEKIIAVFSILLFMINHTNSLLADDSSINLQNNRSNNSGSITSDPNSSLIQVKFSEASATITNEDLQNILTAIKDIKLNELDEVIVATWSDRPYPIGDSKLHNSDVKLADNRAQVVKDTLNDHDIKSVKIVNMAEKPGIISTLFSTIDSSIKRNKEGKNISNNDEKTQAIVRSINARGGPGSVVIYANYAKR